MKNSNAQQNMQYRRKQQEEYIEQKTITLIRG